MAPPPSSVKTVGKTWAKKMNAFARAEVTRMSSTTTIPKSRVRGRNWETRYKAHM
ncbi:hypothetical protein GBAR_LOCUS25448 [Geodia barretti]|uniref:Uncharacterized protein n=1 Tax=Geodia barretti TaxID=519541 RepID=A0AA35X5F4_GEOBA|nr:hypothetical protein GBAR_LOCUS25448 [Geodia barretti]